MEALPSQDTGLKRCRVKLGAPPGSEPVERPTRGETETKTLSADMANDRSQDERRRRRARARQRAEVKRLDATQVSQPLHKTPHRLSLLERRSVTQTTEETYKRTCDLFTEFCLDEQLDVTTEPQLDLAVLAYLDFCYLEGLPADVGEKLIAALRFVRTDVAILGKAALPRGKRAAKGFAKVMPPRSRVPLPWEWCAGLAATLHRQGHRDSAVALLTGFDTYVRPGALLKVTVADVLRPVAAQGLGRWGLILFPQERGELSKTGTQDDTVILGNMDVDLVPLMQRQMRGKNPDQPLFSINMKEYRTHFTQAAVALGLGHHNLVAYQARHGGASRDILLKRREMEEVRKRGHWRTYASVRRYEKSGRVQRVMQTTPAALLKYCQRVAPRLGELLLGPPAAVPPLRR